MGRTESEPETDCQQPWLVMPLLQLERNGVLFRVVMVVRSKTADTRPTLKEMAIFQQ